LSLATGTQQVYINQLTPGMYMIRFRTENGESVSKKLIVE
jgi:hypothetical protein